MIERKIALAVPLAAIGLLVAVLFAGGGSPVGYGRTGGRGDVHWPVPDLSAPALAAQPERQTEAIEKTQAAGSSDGLLLLIWDQVAYPSGIASVGELPNGEQLANEAESVAELSWQETPTQVSSKAVGTPAKLDTPQLVSRQVSEGSVSVTASRSQDTATPSSGRPKAVEPAELHPTVPGVGQVGMTLCSNGCEAVTESEEIPSLTASVTWGRLNQSLTAPIGAQG
jgi:hypothetical protein